MIKFEKRFLESPYFIKGYERLQGEKYEFTTHNHFDYLNVIRCMASYGYDKGLYEMAYIEGCGAICEPLGYLSVDDVLTIVRYENGEKVENSELINCWENSKGANGCGKS